MWQLGRQQLTLQSDSCKGVGDLHFIKAQDSSPPASADIPAKADISVLPSDQALSSRPVHCTLPQSAQACSRETQGRLGVAASASCFCCLPCMLVCQAVYVHQWLVTDQLCCTHTCAPISMVMCESLRRMLGMQQLQRNTSE